MTPGERDNGWTLEVGQLYGWCPISEAGASSAAVWCWGWTMSEVGKTNIVVMWTVAEGDVAEGDRIFESHVKWMTGHPREGDTALLSYRISKGP